MDGEQGSFEASAVLDRHTRIWGILIVVTFVVVLAVAGLGRLVTDAPPFQGSVAAGEWLGVDPFAEFAVSGDEIHGFRLEVPAPNGCASVIGIVGDATVNDGRTVAVEGTIRVDRNRIVVQLPAVRIGRGTFSGSTFVAVTGRFDGATAASGTYSWKSCLSASGETMYPDLAGGWRAKLSIPEIR